MVGIAYSYHSYPNNLSTILTTQVGLCTINRLCHQLDVHLQAKVSLANKKATQSRAYVTDYANRGKMTRECGLIGTCVDFTGKYMQRRYHKFYKHTQTGERETIAMLSAHTHAHTHTHTHTHTHAHAHTHTHTHTHDTLPLQQEKPS